VADAIGAHRMGMRLSPFGGFNNMRADPLMHDLFAHLARELSAIGLLYLHIVDLSSTGLPPVPAGTLAAMRQGFVRTIILSGGFTKESAADALASGTGDLIAFGRPFISNPKLVSKLRNNQPLTLPDASTYYTLGPGGYIDYDSST
jgi:N-ethylmaleimide reductase